MISNYRVLFGFSVIAVLISSHVMASEALTSRGYTFEIEGMSQEEQIKKFDVDSQECAAAADEQYQKNVEESELLSKVYGQKMDAGNFKQMADAQFVDCMTGSISNNQDSKGWSLKK